MNSQKMMARSETPAALGYRFPAQWEPHAATWLAWPHNRETWPGNFERIPPLLARLVGMLAERERVCILAGGDAVISEAQRMVGDLPGVALYDIPTDDAWCRDFGPMFLAGPAADPPALIDWRFNSWGGKYPPFDNDEAAGGRIAAQIGRRRFAPGIVLEGGAVETNGRGTVLVGESCVLNPNRNPGLSRPEAERYLADYCGARKVLWLSGAIAGDDTDGHVDQMARFVGERCVVVSQQSDRGDENYRPLAENRRRLEAMSDQDGRPLELVPLPMPRPCFHNAVRLPASYANFYIANGLVVVPQFDDPEDRAALDTLAKLFPDRQVHGLDALDLIRGLGAFHCLTQQQPATHPPLAG